MQGQHKYQPKLFVQIDIEKLIPQNHLLRKIDQILDKYAVYTSDLSDSIYNIRRKYGKYINIYNLIIFISNFYYIILQLIILLLII